jgi:hypothetical protein
MFANPNRLLEKEKARVFPVYKKEALRGKGHRDQTSRQRSNPSRQVDDSKDQSINTVSNSPLPITEDVESFHPKLSFCQAPKLLIPKSRHGSTQAGKINATGLTL